MRKEKSFLASAEIAGRIGVIESRYRVPDGRYILSERDLRTYRFSMTPEEFVNGLDVEILTDKQLNRLIRKSTLGLANAQMDAHLVGKNNSSFEQVEELNPEIFNGNGEEIDILEEQPTTETEAAEEEVPEPENQEVSEKPEQEASEDAAQEDASMENKDNENKKEGE
jgi:hypothetical protein